MERWYLPIRCHLKGRGEKHADRLIEEILTIYGDTNFTISFR